MSSQISDDRDDRDGPLLNHDIRYPKVRVIGPEGEMLGVMHSREALLQAQNADMDLLEINPTAEPPVVKILDYGKYRYEQQKRRTEARKRQRVVETKEIKLRPNIDTHDYATKMAAVRRFLVEGDKVRITLKFKGREVTHQELGFQLFERVQTDLADIARLETVPRLEGRQIGMLVANKLAP